jgi:hypothetical protein
MDDIEMKRILSSGGNNDRSKTNRNKENRKNRAVNNVNRFNRLLTFRSKGITDCLTADQTRNHINHFF